jgi:hypothetical protein
MQLVGATSPITMLQPDVDWKSCNNPACYFHVNPSLTGFCILPFTKFTDCLYCTEGD